jgi:hypothetical protein
LKILALDQFSINNYTKRKLLVEAMLTARYYNRLSGSLNIIRKIGDVNKVYIIMGQKSVEIEMVGVCRGM